MGFANKSGRNIGHYTYVIAGKFAKKVDEATAGAVARTNKNDKVVHELLYDELDEMIFQSATIESSDFGDQIKIEMESEGETFQLSVPYESRYGNSLLWKLPFMDITKKFYISPYDFEGDDGKKIVGFSIKQNGEKLKSGYGDEAPQPTMKKVRGKDTWDFTEREEFLHGKFVEWAKNADPMAIEEPVTESPTEKPIKEQILAKNAANGSNDEEDDDLPF